MKIPSSVFLQQSQKGIQKLVDALSQDFPFVSVLGTDCEGVRFQAQKSGVEVIDSMWVDRGFVVRVYDQGQYVEYAFNQIPADGVESLAQTIGQKVSASVSAIASSFSCSTYPVIEEALWNEEWQAEVTSLPSDFSADQKIEKLQSLTQKGLAQSPDLVDVRTVYEEVLVRKMYISRSKQLMQSYLWSQGYVMPIVRRDEKTQFAFGAVSGLKGPELFEEMELMAPQVIDECLMLLDAERVKPGEYEVICSPEISGLIAHEAFGHGVEMDMFVKGRAKAQAYIGQSVASELVRMHDGAAACQTVSSYLFDDEGNRASDTLVIEDGILRTGIADQLSALRLGVEPTGNGKRQSFASKAYTRMTNTFFESGKDILDEMIQSIDHGYLLHRMMSGMEDPKNWGIQCMVLYGQEIKDGALTGRIVSPVIMTGYVPDLLHSITMVSDEWEIFGSGACGKGYKEFVKTGDGGPYIKCRARLG